MAHVSDFKKKTVNDIVKLGKEYPIVGVVNMENLPAPQLQAMRAELRGKVGLYMTKKTLMKVALEKMKDDIKGIESLEEYFTGMPALIFTKDSPFRLAKILKKSKTPAPAKAGQTAPDDIIIPKGPTPFAPGPVISELSSAGLKVGVEGGKVAVKEDAVVAKKGDKITGKVAEVLTRLGIKPMEVGLDLMVAYEAGTIYKKDVLDVDEQQYLDNLNLAAFQSFNLAFNIAYVTKDNAKLLIGKAFNDAKALGMSQNIIDKGIIDELLAKAEKSMLSLKSTANIGAVEKPKEEPKEEKPEEKPVEEKKPKEKKPEETPKPEEKKPEQPKPEVKEEAKPIEKEKPKEEIIEKKEEVKPEPKEEKKQEEKPKAEEKPQPKQEAKEEEQKIEGKEPEKEEDIYEEEVREELVNGGEISPAEEGFMEGYDEAGRTGEEKRKEQKPEDEIDKKVEQMVEQTKKFMEHGEETAEDILKEVEKEGKKETEGKEPKEEKKKDEVPSAHDLKEKKKEDEAKSEEDLKREKEKKEQEEVENLTKELLRKGTLRK